MDKEKAKSVQAEVCKTALKMLQSGLTAGTWGNISARIDDDYMAITPSGMDYEKLLAEQMVIMNINDFSYEGNLKPSIEGIVHSSILKARPELNAVVHTHSNYALTCASARIEIPPICDDQVQILGGSIKLAPYTMPGSQEMADSIVEAMTDRMGCLIANHGALTAGRTLSEAFVASQVVEKTAMIYINCQAIGGPSEISQEDIDFFHEFFMEKYGQR
ncbi:MAG: class II aldolase/adducin family protein [Eggerthellaceae bacterium]|nr:class II aldolase/adducin family protein [Eggerthellaceae bacterium]